MQSIDAIWNGNQGREIDITGGDANAKGNVQNAYSTGSVINLDSNAVLSTSGGGASATVFVGQLGTQGRGKSFNEYDFSGLTKVTASDSWDVKITLSFQSRGDVVYYFQES